MTAAPADRSPNVAARAGWLALGLACVGLGGLGIVVPGLPTTIFFIAAAACFARSNARLETWVLGLRGIGPMVQDHREGLGMPRRAKVIATACILGSVTLGLFLAIRQPLVVGAVVVAALVGIGTIWWRVPTREVVLRPPEVRP